MKENEEVHVSISSSFVVSFLPLLLPSLTLLVTFLSHLLLFKVLFLHHIFLIHHLSMVSSSLSSRATTVPLQNTSEKKKHRPPLPVPIPPFPAPTHNPLHRQRNRPPPTFPPPLPPPAESAFRPASASAHSTPRHRSSLKPRGAAPGRAQCLGRTVSPSPQPPPSSSGDGLGIIAQPMLMETDARRLRRAELSLTRMCIIA